MWWSFRLVDVKDDDGCCDSALEMSLRKMECYDR